MSGEEFSKDSLYTDQSVLEILEISLSDLASSHRGHMHVGRDVGGWGCSKEKCDNIEI